MDTDSQSGILVHHVIQGVLKGRHIGHQAGAGDDPLPKCLPDGKVRGARDTEIIGVDDDIFSHVVLPPWSAARQEERGLGRQRGETHLVIVVTRVSPSPPSTFP
jgi:hypothetical protein